MIISISIDKYCTPSSLAFLESMAKHFNTRHLSQSYEICLAQFAPQSANGEKLHMEALKHTTCELFLHRYQMKLALADDNGRSSHTISCSVGVHCPHRHVQQMPCKGTGCKKGLDYHLAYSAPCNTTRQPICRRTKTMPLRFRFQTMTLRVQSSKFLACLMFMPHASFFYFLHT